MLRREVETLTAGLESNRLTGVAVGLLMARYGLGRSAAFAFLRRLSQDSNIKLVEVARGIVDAAEEHMPHDPQHLVIGNGRVPG